ncbi:MAG: 4Fe-4S binding protein [Deltaproteobacteria bacterium]|nr:4Fe-4S binding protein [Deltaproteobacteria bacterium]MBW2532365.1 4Fe-4S binding protein [Deltaproteobacteria bacterium]
MIDVVVDEERCTGCGQCVAFCPYDAVSLQDGCAVIDEGCLRCTGCVSVCPEYALSLERTPPRPEPLRRGPRPARL